MKRAMMVAAALCLLAGPGTAQERWIANFHVVRACAADVVRLCGDVLPGGGRVKACLNEKKDSLSADCLDAVLVAAADARETPNTQPVPIPADPQNKLYMGLRGVIYCEVWLFTLTKDKDIAGVYYNTSDLNNSADKMNTCPAALWDKVTVPSLESQFDVLAAYRNGPRGWTMDTLELPVGPVIAFDGLETRWMGQGILPKGVALTQAHMTPYAPLKSHRKSSFTFNKGKPVFILDDPSGTPWVMQAFGQIVDPTLTYDTLKDLGAKLKPPAGWKFRMVVLDKDLTISTPEGYNWIVQDEIQNTYDACKDGACSFQP